jgi:hypothetical protein
MDCEAVEIEPRLILERLAEKSLEYGEPDCNIQQLSRQSAVRNRKAIPDARAIIEDSDQRVIMKPLKASEVGERREGRSIDIIPDQTTTEPKEKEKRGLCGLSSSHHHRSSEFVFLFTEV